MRRTLLLLSILPLLVYGPLARAQNPAKIPRVGVFDTFCRDGHHKRLREALREIGYVDGENLELVNNCIKDKSIELKARAVAMARREPDVIVARSTPGIRAIQGATSTIPIVMIKFGDPVVAGEAESFARPGGNITGVSGVRQDYAPKMLEILKEAFPEISRVTFLTGQNIPSIQNNTEFRAKALGIKFQIANVENLENLNEIFAAMTKQKVDGIIYRGGPRLSRGLRQIIKLAEASRLPVIYTSAIAVKAGGLMSYGPDQREMYRRAAYQVHKILNGANAGKLPVERFTKGELVINLRTAERLGLEISPETLMFADKVIR